MNTISGLWLKTYIVVGAIGVGVILLADYGRMVINNGVKRIYTKSV